MGGKSESLSPDFESGMLVGYADGLLLMHRILTEAVEITSSTVPGVSAFLKAFAGGMGGDLLNMLRAYHEARGLSVPLDITVMNEDKQWN